MTTGTKPARNAERYYVWSAPDNTFSIHLSLDVVERLSRDLLLAAIENPARDISGTLLGRSIVAFSPTTVVDEFVLASDQSTIAASASADNDNTVAEMWRLVREAESGRHIVGFFRSQRDGPMVPNNLDLINAGRLRGETDNVLLLIRLLQSGESEATFFHWEDGNVQYPGPDAAFPFDATRLPSASPSKPQQLGPDLLEQLRLPQAVVTHAAGEASVWLRLLPTFALFAVVTAGIQLLPSPWPRTTQTAEIASGDASPLGLNVAVQPQQLDIRWNHSSTQILAAEKVVLEIMEGDVSEKIPLDRQERRDGYVAYTPKTNDVYVRLVVNAADNKSSTESVRVVAIP